MESIGQFLVLINSEESPQRDQDVVDLLSDFYIFVIFGHDAEAYPEGIKDWEDLWTRIRRLERSSQHTNG